MKVSILGVGFIGRQLLESYLNKGCEISILDHKSCPDKYKPFVNWEKADFTNLKTLRQVIKKSDVVYHLISSTVPADNVDENEEIMKNVSQTINLLKLCVDENVKKIIFMSSSSVYGIQKKTPISEMALTDPISSHGIHKLTIEKYIQLYKYQYGLDCKIVRLSNPYGMGQNIFGRQGIIAISIGKIVLGKPIVIHGNGEAIRDFIHIDDVINACHLIAESMSNEIVFNVGSGIGLSINVLLNELQEFSSCKINIEYVHNRANDILESVLDISKAQNILNFNPGTTIKEGLYKSLVDYSKKIPELNDYFNVVRL